MGIPQVFYRSLWDFLVGKVQIDTLEIPFRRKIRRAIIKSVKRNGEGRKERSFLMGKGEHYENKKAKTRDQIGG